MKLALLFLIFGIACILQFGFMHEQVHKIIYESYGIESKITTNFPHLVTVPTTDASNCNETCRLAHHINEAVSYPLLPFMSMIFMGLLIIISIIDKK